MVRQTTIDQIIPLGNSFVLNSIFSYTVETYKEKEIIGENSIYILEQNFIDYLENMYIFKNPVEIKRFLANNNDLIDILVFAPIYIYEIFGNVPIYLELHHDLEEEWEELFIIIKTNNSPEEAFKLENELFEKWFIKILDKVEGRLNFTEEPL